MSINKIKILILDSASMSGHMISRYLKDTNKYIVIDVVFEEINKEYGKLFDIYQLDRLIDFIDNKKPDIVINSVRLLVQESDKEPHKAIYINSYFPRFLEEHYLNSHTKIIQLSTDCVFSGNKGGYIESSPKDGNDMYSKSRALGEINNKKDLTIRTSFIGPVLTTKPEELFDWFLMQEGEVKGFINAYWTGVSTLELSINIEKAINLNITGIYHLVPKNKISKYELLKLLKEIWNKEEIQLLSYNNDLVDKSLLDTRQLLGVNDYREMFIFLKEYMIVNSNLYSKYFQLND